MVDGGLFKLLPLPPSWAKYVGAQYAADPSLSSAPAPAIPGFRKLPELMEAQAPVDSGPPSFDPLPVTPLGASNTPGFDKSPGVLEALSAADPRPPGFYGSTALLGARALLPTPDPNLSPAIGQQAMLFSGPGATSLLPPLPAPWSGYVRARYASDPSLAPNTGAPVGPDLTPVGNPTASLPIGGSPSVSSTSNPYLIPARVDSTPIAGPQAIGEPSVQPVDPSVILAQVRSQPIGQQPTRPSPSPKPESPIADSNDPASVNWRGRELVLPDGSTVDDSGDGSRSPTGHVMTPVIDLDEVAAAGRRAGERLRSQLQTMKPEERAGIGLSLLFSALMHVGTGGQFDYQRQGDQFLGILAERIPGLQQFRFVQRRQFHPIANINVGLWAQQAGLTLEQTLELSGWYARQSSSNAEPKSEYGLAERTEHFIREGYRIGQSGMFDRKDQ